MRAWICFAVLVAFAVNITPAAAEGSQTLLDVSWPNCETKPSGVHPGIVGVNGGLAFRPNPCLAEETGWFDNLSAYLNTGYPGLPRALKYKDSPKSCADTDEECLAYNYGYNAGRYDIKYASLHYVIAKQWWLDVETSNSWSDSTTVNRAALIGMTDAMALYVGRDNLGFYSYPGQWDLITGRWHNGYPAWVATGSSDRSEAALACDLPGFTGGKIVMAQYVRQLDQNFLCHP